MWLFCRKVMVIPSYFDVGYTMALKFMYLAIDIVLQGTCENTMVWYMFKRHDSSMIPRPNNHGTFQYSFIRRCSVRMVHYIRILWYIDTQFVLLLLICTY